MVWVFALRLEGESWIALGSGPLLNFHTGIGLPCPGANTTHGRAAHYDVNVLFHRSLRIKGWLAQLPYVSVEVVAMDKVLDLVLQVIAFLSIMPIVAVEATVTSTARSSAQHLSGLGVFRSPFSWIWRKIYVRVELSRTLGGQGMVYSLFSILLLESPKGGP
ncbi:hypothetical protein BHE74_00045502 [Ensete ventricosum]|nr:hypothetical protein BHE74_00045502 [Ensete ventricosum]